MRKQHLWKKLKKNIKILLINVKNNWMKPKLKKNNYYK